MHWGEITAALRASQYDAFRSTQSMQWHGASRAALARDMPCCGLQAAGCGLQAAGSGLGQAKHMIDRSRSVGTHSVTMVPRAEETARKNFLFLADAW